MLELIAQGPTLNYRWRRTLPGATVELGRSTETYRVPWDNQVSRRHAQLTASEHKLHVKIFAEAANPIFFNGREVSDFYVRPGEHFVIGNTSFMVAADQAFGSLTAPDPVRQQTFSADFLEQVQYSDADRRISVLNRLPEVIAAANNSDDLLIGMVNTLMAGISAATTIGVVQLDSDPLSTGAQVVDEGRLRVIHWDRRGLARGDFQPSEKLVAQAVQLKQSVLNVWQSDVDNAANYTFDYENDWAFTCPIETEATPGWAVYVAGSSRLGETPEQIQEGAFEGDIKFCELVGATLKNLLRVQQLERQQASLRTFFSPVVVDALRGSNPETVLQPRQCEVSVLFCDLRGFSQKSEQMADDLFGLLTRVSESLGVTTRVILDTGGVIGDFHGDAVMGFWGWPLEDRSPTETARAAVLAAIQIQTEFSQLGCQQSLANEFTMGIGIATGTAVAGKIGTRDQVKVTAFGPVVNLAARLEGMTRRLSTCILVDENTKTLLDRSNAQAAGQTNPVHRRMGNFQPFGMTTPVQLYQILSDHGPATQQRVAYDQALELFESGEIERAIAGLTLANEATSSDSSGSANEFLLGFLKQAQATGTADGIIRMWAK